MSAVDDMDAAGPRVRDDMTVEVALSVMAGARVEYLLLCDGDDQCTGSITRAELAVHRGSSTYTDRLRLRDVLEGAITSTVPRSVAVGEHGRPPGILALSR
ncbi:CBS domain-containing protein [Streptomyces sp. NPDC055506]